jgi:hypothetical protein
VNSSQGGGSKDTWIVGGGAAAERPGPHEPGGLAGLVADQASVTQAIPIIYDAQASPDQAHARRSASERRSSSSRSSSSSRG